MSLGTEEEHAGAAPPPHSERSHPPASRPGQETLVPEARGVQGLEPAPLGLPLVGRQWAQNAVSTLVGGADRGRQGKGRRGWTGATGRGALDAQVVSGAS